MVWLRNDFTVEDSTPYDDDGINGLAIDDAGGVAMSRDTSDPEDPGEAYGHTAVISFAPDHSVRWSGGGPTFGGVAAASSEIIITEGSEIVPGPNLFGVHVADGSMAWSKQLSGGAAFAADGSLIMAGEFGGTLELGGTTTPLVASGTDTYVAAFDPLTGNARWALDLGAVDVGSTCNLVTYPGTGPAGEIAVWHSPGLLSLIDGAGSLQWTVPFDPCPGAPTALLPDGDRVLTSIVTYTPTTPPYYASTVAEYSASGLDWQHAIPGTGLYLQLLALADDRLDCRDLEGARGVFGPRIGDDR